MPRRSCSPYAVIAWPLLALLAISSGCGSGTVSALSGGSSGGGGTNVPPAIAGFRVVDPLTQGPPRTSPAEIRFVLTDAEGNPAQVEFLYHVPGFAAEHMTQVSALPGNPASLPASAAGTEYALSWDFADEDLLPDDASYTAGVLVYARVQGSNVILAGANSAQLGLGNDAPVVEVDALPTEVDGVVPVRLHLSDSSSDAIDVRVEFDIQGDVPNTGWQIARPGGLLPATPTPPFAFQDIVVGPEPGGVDVVFFWDTDVDLRNLERDVILRVTPIDPAIAGAAIETNPFRVDNNAVPIVQLHEGLLLSGAEHQRGVPIPFSVQDDEGDVVRVVFQWRSPTGSYPTLPNDPVELEAILADPSLRTEHQICTEYPSWIEGRAVPVDAQTVRLPELAHSAVQLLHGGLVGSEIQLLRPKAHFASLATTEWPTGVVFDRPVAALPIGDGRRALVLEALDGAWRLSEIVIASGSTQRDFGTWPYGAPSAMDWDVGQHAVLVASDLAGSWQLTRVDLDDATVSHLASIPLGATHGPIKGMATLDSAVVLATAGDALVRIDWADPAAPRAVVLLADLEDPQGIAVDRLERGTAYVAERSARTSMGLGRILVVDTYSLERYPLPVGTSSVGGAPFPEPEALAIDREGSRLIVATRDPVSRRLQLRELELAAASGREVVVLDGDLEAGVTSIACGREGLILACQPDRQDLLACGGLQQARKITSVDPATQRVSVTVPFVPHPRAGQAWRISSTSGVLVAKPAEKRATFCWDATDSPGKRVLFRASAFDAESGVPSATEAPIDAPQVSKGRAVALANVVSTGFDSIVDLDRDGRMDVANLQVGAESALITVHFQECLVEYTIAQFSGAPTPGWPGFEAVDIDQNGLLDLLYFAHGPEDKWDIGALLQVQPRAFQQAVLVPDAIPFDDPELPTVTHSFPYALAAVDLDSDGDVEIACTARLEISFGPNSVDQRIVFSQEAPLVFRTTAAETSQFPYVYSTLEVLDIDGDGTPELCGPGETCAIVRGQFECQALPIHPFPHFLADMNGDARIDLVETPFGVARIWLQNSDGTFPSTWDVQVVVELDVDSYASVRAVDHDQDGDLDLVWWTYDGFYVRRQATPGSFESAGLRVGWSTLAGLYGRYLGDLDRDGRLDALFGDMGVPASIGLTGQPFQRPGPETLLGLNSACLGILDAEPDGDFDVLVNESGVGFAVMLQDPVAGTTIWPIASGTYGAPSLGDLDGDGDLDLLAGNSSGWTVFLREAAGFEAQSPILSDPAVQGALDIDLVDVNGDARLDVCAANYSQNLVAIFLQGTDGAFAPTPSFVGVHPEQIGSRALAIADLDGDGDQDLACANYFSRNLCVYWQTAPGIFSADPTLLGGPTVMGSPMDLLAADLDGDGDTDLASCNLAGQVLAVFWQASRGVFAREPTLFGEVPSSFGAQSLCAADLDRDGDLDLIVSGLGRGVYRQLRRGRFGAETCSPSSNPPSGSFPVDFDLDGDTDLIGVTTVYWGGR